MLLGDGYLATLPALAELVQIGEDHVAEQRVDGHDREQAVEHRLGAGFVELVERASRAPSRIASTGSAGAG